MAFDRPDELELTSRSVEQTAYLGKCLGELIEAGDLICLSGDLGAGKTAFATGVGKGWGVLEQVNSPTFVFAHEHHRQVDSIRLYHIDCYRLRGSDDAESIGIDDMLSGEHCLLIEWPERIADILPESMLQVHIAAVDDASQRILGFQALGTRYQTLLEQFRHRIQNEYPST